MLPQIISFLADSEIVAALVTALTGSMAVKSVVEVFKHRKAFSELENLLRAHQTDSGKLKKLLADMKVHNIKAVDEAIKIVSDEARLLPEEYRNRVEPAVNQASSEGRASVVAEIISESLSEEVDLAQVRS